MAVRAPSQVRHRDTGGAGPPHAGTLRAAGDLPSATRAAGHARLDDVHARYFSATRASSPGCSGRAPGPALTLPGATHALDLTAYAAYVWLLGGPALPVLAWFLFVLVAATLRWGWRGALTTGSVGVAIHAALGAESSSLRTGVAHALQFITIALLMGVMTIFVGLLGAYEDWRGMQLAKLASWSGPDPDQPDDAASRNAGAHLRGVLEAPRTLLIWEEVDEPWTEVAIWDEGRIEQTREPPGSLGEVVAERLTGASFFCRDVASSRPVTFIRSARGVESWQGMPIDARLRDRFKIRAVAVWPLRGDTFRGWLFCLDRPAFLAAGRRPRRRRRRPGLGPAVAGVSGPETARDGRHDRARAARARPARRRPADTDGCRAAASGGATSTCRSIRPPRRSLSQVQRIIAAGQNDLRFFINQLGPQRAAESSGPVDLRGASTSWPTASGGSGALPVTVATEPELLAIPDLLVSDLFLLIHEALVNAARHARARRFSWPSCARPTRSPSLSPTTARGSRSAARTSPPTLPASR